MNKLTPRRSELNPFNVPPVVVICVVICGGFFIIPRYFLSDELQRLFLLEFSFIPWKLTMIHSPMSILSLITSSLLHANNSHIINNMIWLVIFGSPLANRLNPWRFLAFWMFTAFIASMTFYIFDPLSTVPLLGASGAISGMLGGAARYGFRHNDSTSFYNRSEFAGPILSITNALRMPIVLSFIGFWLLVNVLIVSLPVFGTQGPDQIAWQAHLGGLLAGFLFVGIFDQRRDATHK